MAFAYLIGVAFFGILYFCGMKIFLYFDPYPEFFPPEKDYCVPSVSCALSINGKNFNCVKKEHIHKDYYYSADCDVIEHKIKHKKYILEKPIGINDVDKTYLSCEVLENGNLIKYYAADDGKTIISCEPEIEERVYSCRKPFKRKKISA